MVIRTRGVATTAAVTATMAMACLLAPAASAQEGLVQGGGGGIAYVSGGIGIEERAAMAARRAEFNLYLAFRRRGSGDLLADVSLQVLDRSRNIVLIAERVGPHVYVQLPPGTYHITANGHGMAQSRDVTVARRGTRAVAFGLAAGGDVAVR